MEIILSYSKWVKGMQVGDVKFGKLANEDDLNSLRCAAYQYSSGLGQRVGNAVRIAYFWSYNVVAAVCVSYDEYVEHKYDHSYAKQWRPQVANLLEQLLEEKQVIETAE